jgi:mercuric ion binding protein
MKNGLMIGLALAALGVGGLVAWNGSSTAAAQNTTRQVAAQQQTAVFAIENMTCAMCPITVKKAMQGVDGVSSVAVDFDAKTATVVFDPSVTNVARISEASTNAGYPASVRG